MASFCILCSKKLGLFSAYGEDIFTGDPSNKICDECLKKAETILKKVELKIPFDAEDYDRFTEDGIAYINEYLEPDGVALGGGAVAVEPTASIKDLEVGEATISRTFEVDEEETRRIVEKLGAMSEEEIEAFLEGLVSDNDTAENFMNDIKALEDEELEAVYSDQREYFNNAEWAYITYVYNFRKGIHTESEEIPEAILPEGELDGGEVERMREQLADKTEEELKAILFDESYTAEARTAAKELINE